MFPALGGDVEKGLSEKLWKEVQKYRHVSILNIRSSLPDA